MSAFGGACRDEQAHRKTRGRSNCKPCLEWRVKLWDAVNRYVVACGGDPSKHAYGNVPRMNAVGDVERIVAHAASEDQIR